MRIETTGGDGKGGCNLTGHTELKVSVGSSNTSVATVAPASALFDSCAAVQTLTVTPRGAGTATISLTQTFNDTGATFNLAPATFTVNVTPTTPPNTPPTVSVTGVEHGASYQFGAVPGAGCSVTDAQDGTPTVSPTLSAVTGPLAGFGLGAQTATCSYTDAGGLAATANATYTIVDTGKPVIDLESRTPAANDSGWNNTPVTVTWSCADTGSGVVANTVTATVQGEGAEQGASGTCADRAGNTASAMEKVSIDKTAPAIKFESRTPSGPGWSTSPVVVTWSCTDTPGGSGAVSSTVSATIDDDRAGQTATGVCADKAGNTSTPATVGNIDVDRTPPTITLKSRTAANANGWNKTDVTVVWDCSDAVSGVVQETVAKTADAAGADQSLAGSCTDGAGNSASATETHINIDKTAPVTTFLSRTPTANTGGWNSADVTVTWSCTDDGGSGVVSPKVSATIDTDGDDQTATGTCADLAGNTSTGSISDVKVDKTPPTIKLESRTPANQAGWNKGAVSVEWSCADTGSGVVASTVSHDVDTEGAVQKATGTCADKAGNTASHTVEDINIDHTAPVTTFESRTPAADAGGWNNSDVTVTWTCTDAGGSGVVSPDGERHHRRRRRRPHGDRHLRRPRR